MAPLEYHYGIWARKPYQVWCFQPRFHDGTLNGPFGACHLNSCPGSGQPSRSTILGITARLGFRGHTFTPLTWRLDKP